MTDDTDDFLDIPKKRKGNHDGSRLNTPAARKKAAKSISKALKLPTTVEVPEGVDPNSDDWWPYPLPSRDNCGRPRKIKTPEEYDRLVDEYLEICVKRRQRPLMTGLQSHIGFSSTASMTDYKNLSPDFARSVSRGRKLIKEAYETNLVRSQGSVQGVTFALRSFANADGENDFNEINKTELTGKDGMPLATVNANLNAMTDIEKASRLLHYLNGIVQQNKTDDEDDDDDFLEI